MNARALQTLDEWPCGVWRFGTPCGRPATERLVRLNPNLPDLPVCAACLGTTDQAALAVRTVER